MKFDFVPKVCRGETPSYKGKVVLDVPKAPERYRYIRESGVLAIYEKMGEKDRDGVEKEEVSFDLASQYDLVTKMSSFVEKHVVTVELERLDDGFKVDNVDALLSIASLESAVMEICVMFLKGFEPGKNSAT